MQGLLFNMLAELSKATEWEDEIWELVLACAESLKVDHEEEDGNAIPDVLRLPDLEAASGALFKCLLRNTLPFGEDDWDEHLEFGRVRTKDRDGSGE